MLHALMDGRALTASELANVAGVTSQTASEHLAKMIAACLVQVEKQGRHRYFRLAAGNVAQMIESIMQVASNLESIRTTPATGPRDVSMRMARTCYDHLAGRLGVAIADALQKGGHLDLNQDGGLVTASGAQHLARIGIDLPRLTTVGGVRGRVLCRPCLDWSERRPHLAGALGNALCTLSFQEDWIRRKSGTRAVIITSKGLRGFRERLNVRMDA